MSELKQQLEFIKSSFQTPRIEKKGETLSFLFSGQKAATLSFSDAHVIGVDGLNELIQVDSRFRPFKETLFSEKSITFNRELHTKQVNEKLDESIRSFLRLLSAYFLLTSAHKAIEYLVKRYKIHVYNVDDIMECILPYHETVLFSRFVQLLSISNTKWYFLSPIQDTGAPLLRDILVQRCHTDFEIMEFICEMVKNYVSNDLGYKTLYSFATVTILEYVEHSQLKDTPLKRILPFVFDGIKSEEKDYKAGALMILTQISSKVKLSEKVLEVCIDLIVDHTNDYNLDTGLPCIVFLCQSQKISRFSPKSFEKLISLKYLIEQLLELSNKYDIFNFVRLFFSTLIDYSFLKKDTELLEKFIKQVPVGDHIPSITYQIFKHYVDNDSLHGITKTVLTAIERKYPEQVDKGVDLTLNNIDESYQQSVLKFVQLTFKGTRHEPVAETNTTLYLSLQHPEASVRILALNHLKSILEDTENPSQTLLDFASDALLDRLDDEDVKVLNTVVRFPRLVEIVETPKLIKKLSELYVKARNTFSAEYAALRSAIVRAVVTPQFIKNKPQFIDQIVPFVLDFLLVDPKFQTTSKIAYNAAARIKHPLFFNLPDLSDSADHNMQVIESISKNLLGDIETILPICLDLLKTGIASELLLCVLNQALMKCQDNEILIELASNLFNLVKDEISNTTYKKKQVELIYKEMKELIKSADIPTLKLFTLLNICNSTPQLDLQENTKYWELLKSIFVLITEHSAFNQFLPHIKALFSKHLKKDTFKFLSLFWTSDLGVIQPIVQERSIAIALTILQALEQQNLNYQMVLPTFLVALCSPLRPVRMTALQCIKTISASCKQDNMDEDDVTVLEQGFYGNSDSKTLTSLNNTGLSEFLEKIDEHSAEFIADSFYLKRLIEELHENNWDYIDDLITYISSHAVAYKKTFPTLVLIESLQRVQSETKFEILHPLMKEMIAKAKEAVNQGIILSYSEHRLLALLLLQFTENIVKLIDKKYLSTYFDALCFYQKVSYEQRKHEALTPTTKSMISTSYVLRNLTPNFYTNLSNESREKLFKKLCYILQHASDSRTTTTKVQDVLNTLPVHAAVIIKSFPEFEKVSNDNVEDVVDTTLSILEAIQFIQDIQEREKLVEPLFGILASFLDPKKPLRNSSFTEYCINMILTALHSLSQWFNQQAKQGNKDLITKFGQHFDVDMIVNCLKEMKSPQIRNHTILLVGEVASMFPERVLSHIVHVLSVMQISLAQHDNFTLGVIEKTLSQIVPAVVSQKMSVKLIADTFVNAFDTIPPQRRLHLFTVLVKELSRKKLFGIIIMLMSKYVKEDKDEILKFCRTLLEFYRIPKQLRCMLELIRFIRAPENESNEFYNPKEHSVSDTRKLKLSLIQFLSDALESTNFLKRHIVHEQKDPKTTQDLLSKIVQNLVLFVVGVSKSKPSQTEEKKFMESLEKMFYKVFSKCQQLLVIKSFIGVVLDLVNKPDPQIRAKAVEVLNLKLSEASEETQQMLKNSKTDVLGVLPVLIKYIKEEDEPAVNKQTNVIAVDLIARLFGAIHPDKFLDSIPEIIALLSDDNMHLVSSAALCLATLCAELGIKVLQYLPAIVKEIIKAMNTTFESPEVSKRATIIIQNSLLSSIDIICRHQVKFISPYLGDILYVLMHNTILKSKYTKTRTKAAELLNFLATNIETRLLLSPLFASYSSCLLLGDLSLLTLFDTVGTVISTLSEKDAEKVHKQFLKFFLSTFDMRRLHSDKITDLDAVEDQMLSTFEKLILKLNENTFKPILLKLLEWSRTPCSALDVEQDETSDSSSPHIDRLQTFYKCVNVITNCLKSIFVPYFAHLLDGCVNDLNRTYVDEEEDEEEDTKKKKRKHSKISKEDSIITKKHNLVKLIFNALQKCFLHDDSEFMHNQSRFDMILSPMVNQIENISLGTAEMFKERVESAIVPCFGQLSLIINQNMWKPLQYQVLLKTQHSKPLVKCASIKVLEIFYEKLGQSFLVMLPELIPYIAELLEDENDVVVNLTRGLIKKIEAISGEDLSEYLKK